MHKKIKVGIIEIKGGSLGRYYETLTKSLSQIQSLQVFIIKSPATAGYKPLRALKYTIKTMRLVDELRKLNLDILHCPHELVPSFFWFTPTASKLITFHGTAPFMVGKDMLPDGFTLRRRCYRWSLRLFKKQVARYITLSKTMKEAVAQGYFLPTDLIDIIHPGVDTEFFHRASQLRIDTLLAHLRIQRPYILWASSYRPVKNLITLVKAFEKAVYLLGKSRQPISLVIAGAKDGDYHNKVMAAVTNKYTRGRIHFMERIHEDLPVLISGARATAVVSFYEGFPFPIMESMACGVPVIATKVGGISEAGGSAVIYVDDPLDVDGMCSAIIQIVKNDRLHKELVERGYEHIKPLCLENFGKRMLSFYENILR